MQLIVGYDWREILSGLEPSIDIVSVQKTHGRDKDCCSNINTTKQEQTFTLKIEVEKTFGLYLKAAKSNHDHEYLCNFIVVLFFALSSCYVQMHDQW